MLNIKKPGLWAVQWALVGAMVAVLAACGAAQETATLPQPVVNQTPTGSFTARANGLTVTFDASASRDAEGPLASYRWNFGDGTTALSTNSATVTHVYSASGTYVVNLVVLDANAVASTVFSQNVTALPLALNQAPSARFAAAANGLSAGVDASLSTDPDGTINTYAWSFGEPGSSTNTANGKTATHTYGTTGTYTVTLVVTDNTGLTATSLQQVNIVGTPNVNPIANFTSTRDALLVSFTAAGSTDSDGTISTYSWNFGESNSPANTATGVTTTHAFKFAGSYTVTLVVTDNRGALGNQQAVVTVIPPVAVATGELNDTGITASQCYQAGSDVLISCTSTAALALNTNQDGMVGRDAFSGTNIDSDGVLGFSFTKIGASGEALPANAPQWSCVKDNVTGLIWENKTTDGGLRDVSNTYTNYDSTTAAQLPTGGIPTQAQIDAATNSVGFKNAVNATGLCGATDWRIPDLNELRDLWNYSATAQNGFDPRWINGRASIVTSSVYSATQPQNNWIFFTGLDAFGLRSNSYSVNLVRGALASRPASRFLVSTDGQEVTDNVTGLVWRRCAEGMLFSAGVCTGSATNFSHEAALNMATKIGGGWQVPNIKELNSIIDRSAFSPAIDAVAFPDTPAGLFWSSTPETLSNAWVASFSQGGAVNFISRTATSNASLRLVRGICFNC
jgi:PKD repeat protein